MGLNEGDGLREETRTRRFGEGMGTQSGSLLTVRCARYPGIPLSQISHLHSLSWIARVKVLALPILTI